MTAPSNANTSGLAPCPFCGGEAWLNEYETKYSDLPPMSRAPQCRSCGVSLGYLTTPAKATEAWNRRVTAASAQARISELEAELEETRTIDAGFWTWLGERDLQPDGPDLEWGDIVVALTEHEARAIRLQAALDARATAAEARADRLAEILSKLNAAISWLDYPFIDNRTPEAELRQRVGFMMKDAEPHRAALQQETQP